MSNGVGKQGCQAFRRPHGMQP
ncbi:MAG: hypothetical protein QOC60_437, partial [Frankiaceae bacterium]|nr:hypothetical protein [Frankiaceae bacterium]